MEHILDALLGQVQSGDDDVIGTQGHLVLQLHTGHHGIDPLLVHLGEAQSALFQKEVARVLAIVDVLGIVDNAFDVTLIVAHFEARFKDIFHFFFKYS